MDCNSSLVTVHFLFIFIIEVVCSFGLYLFIRSTNCWLYLYIVCPAELPGRSAFC